MTTFTTYEQTCDNCGLRRKVENPILKIKAFADWWRVSTDGKSFDLCSQKCVGQFKPDSK